MLTASCTAFCRCSSGMPSNFADTMIASSLAPQLSFSPEMSQRIMGLSFDVSNAHLIEATISDRGDMDIMNEMIKFERNHKTLIGARFYTKSRRVCLENGEKSCFRDCRCSGDGLDAQHSKPNPIGLVGVQCSAQLEPMLLGMEGTRLGHAAGGFHK
jgi:hypothetical protein